MNLRTKLIRLAHANPKLRADILPLLSRTAANKKYSVIKPIKWKDGSVTEVGEVVEVTYKFTNPKVAYLQVGGTTKVLGIPKLSLYLKGYPRMPNMAALRRMEENGIATTPSGHRVELDGQGPDGSPSWWLVWGLL